MRMSVFIAVGLAALVIGCDKGQTRTTTSPTLVPTVVSLRISGPSTIGPSETAPFSATAQLSDGSTANYTDKVSWRSTKPAVLTITPGGHATGQASGEAQVQAHPTTGGRVVTAHVLVIPAGTYRLTGRVRESGLPVSDATVAVVSGQGTGLSTLTDPDGDYRLYGVAGPIQIQVSKSGYDSLVRGLTVSTTEVLDITDLRQTGEIVSLAGAYTLTLTAASKCSALPAEARSRTYAAALTQDGPILHVSLSGADFESEKNHFSGRVTPKGVTFNLTGDGYYYLADLDVIERLSPISLLTFIGTADATIARNGISGSFTGTFAFVIGQGTTGVILQNPCFGTHQFTLTPLARSMT